MAPPTALLKQKRDRHRTKHDDRSGKDKRFLHADKNEKHGEEQGVDDYPQIQPRRQAVEEYGFSPKNDATGGATGQGSRDTGPNDPSEGYPRSRRLLTG